MPKNDKDLKAQARKIWLAGLGALAVAEKEGEKLFNALAAAGSDLETGSMKKAKGKVKATLKKLRNKTGNAIDNIESSFDKQLRSALKKMQVPSQDEIAKLNKKIAKLEKALEESTRSGKSKARAPATRKSATTKKPVAKKKASKKVAKKTADAIKGN